MGGCQRGTPIVRRTPTIFKIRSCCFADQYIICISEMRRLLGFGFMIIRGKKYQPLNLYIFFGKTLHKEHPGHDCVRLSRVRYSLEICSMLYQHAVKSINKCLVITFQKTIFLVNIQTFIICFIF